MADMEACMKAATPGEPHQKLDQFAGTWKAITKHWMQPGAEPIVGGGTMTNTWVLGNRYLRQDYRDANAEKPFEGTGYWGYNNITGRYEGLWIDTMGTGMMSDVGDCDGAGKVWTMQGEAEFPAAGQKMTKRSVITVHDHDHHTMEMFFTGPDGNEFKSMEIEYTRQN